MTRGRAMPGCFLYGSWGWPH